MSTNYQIEIGKILGVCMVFVNSDQLEKITQRLMNFHEKPDVFWATIEILIPEDKVRELIKPIIEKLALSEEKVLSKPLIQPKPKRKPKQKPASEWQAVKLAATTKATLYIVKTKGGWKSMWIPKSLFTYEHYSVVSCDNRKYSIHNVCIEEWFIDKHGIAKGQVDESAYQPIVEIIKKSKSDYKKTQKRSKFASTQGRPD